MMAIVLVATATFVTVVLAIGRIPDPILAPTNNRDL